MPDGSHQNGLAPNAAEPIPYSRGPSDQAPNASRQAQGADARLSQCQAGRCQGLHPL